MPSRDAPGYTYEDQDYWLGHILQEGIELTDTSFRLEAVYTIEMEEPEDWDENGSIAHAAFKKKTLGKSKRKRRPSAGPGGSSSAQSEEGVTGIPDPVTPLKSGPFLYQYYVVRFDNIPNLVKAHHALDASEFFVHKHLEGVQERWQCQTCNHHHESRSQDACLWCRSRRLNDAKVEPVADKTLIHHHVEKCVIVLANRVVEALAVEAGYLPSNLGARLIDAYTRLEG